jgi:hypothetical protein
MCCLLVSGFLTEITQQIHSLRASGVISSHFARASESKMRTFRKSTGTLWTAPGEIAFLLMNFILHLMCRGLRSSVLRSSPSLFPHCFIEFGTLTHYWISSVVDMSPWQLKTSGSRAKGSIPLPISMGW